MEVKRIYNFEKEKKVTYSVCLNSATINLLIPNPPHNLFSNSTDGIPQLSSSENSFILKGYPGDSLSQGPHQGYMQGIVKKVKMTAVTCDLSDLPI